MDAADIPVVGFSKFADAVDVEIGPFEHSYPAWGAGSPPKKLAVVDST
jgi:hypothetical protein